MMNRPDDDSTDGLADDTSFDATCALQPDGFDDDDDDTTMNAPLLNYYEAIEQASADMLQAARDGNWDRVVKLEGACALLISQLKHAASRGNLGPEEAQLKSRIMRRILVNDAEIRVLAEPWLEDLDDILAGKPKTVH